MDKTPTTKEEAIVLAKQVGEQAYGNINMFEIAVKDDATYWKIDFAQPQAVADGESQHFSVWVDKKTARTRLFRGR